MASRSCRATLRETAGAAETLQDTRWERGRRRAEGKWAWAWAAAAAAAEICPRMTGAGDAAIEGVVEENGVLMTNAHLYGLSVNV